MITRNIPTWAEKSNIIKMLDYQELIKLLLVRYRIDFPRLAFFYSEADFWVYNFLEDYFIIIKIWVFDLFNNYLISSFIYIDVFIVPGCNLCSGCSNILLSLIYKMSWKNRYCNKEYYDSCFCCIRPFYWWSPILIKLSLKLTLDKP